MLHFKNLLFGLLGGFALTAALNVLCAFVILKLGFLPGSSGLGTVSACIGGISAFVFSALTARWVGKTGLLHGLVFGVAYAAAFVALGVILYANIQCIAAVIRSVIFVICSVIGGVIGVNKAEKVRF